MTWRDDNYVNEIVAWLTPAGAPVVSVVPAAAAAGDPEVGEAEAPAEGEAEC